MDDFYSHRADLCRRIRPGEQVTVETWTRDDIKLRAVHGTVATVASTYILVLLADHKMMYIPETQIRAGVRRIRKEDNHDNP